MSDFFFNFWHEKFDSSQEPKTVLSRGQKKLREDVPSTKNQFKFVVKVARNKGNQETSARRLELMRKHFETILKFKLSTILNQETLERTSHRDLALKKIINLCPVNGLMEN